MITHLHNYPALTVGTVVTVKGCRGVAHRIVGLETEPGDTESVCYECNGRGCEGCDATGMLYDEDPEPIETGRLLVCMVGDDYRHGVDPEDCTIIAREDYCGECGQVGCAHDGLDRSE